MAGRNARTIDNAVIQHDGATRQGLLERAFAFAFRGLVYAQIWEDPVVDMEALAITPDCHVVTIASGGCNVLSYLTANPGRITAVDLNTAHVALNRLKLTAAERLPGYGQFRRFFGDADCRENIEAYDRHIRPHLDEVSRRYWEGRDLVGRRRIGMFRRWLTEQPASLFGLGIPPAQYTALAGGSDMASVLRARLERLACGHALHQNYFAWQAFGRGYAKDAEAPLPPYLQAGNHAVVAERAERVDVVHANMTDWLGTQPDGSLDRYILLDAQDWMTDAQLTALWTEITRTARPGARVLFRTAAEPSLLPGRVPDMLLDRWDYRAESSIDFTARDRSAIYGGVHLYILRG
jgi:S-adenosylmethionine-diacylglycerol 3-amino-3-carboxypropyl transferase